jgi:hypothetical protein
VLNMTNPFYKDVESYLSTCIKDKSPQIDLSACHVNYYNPDYSEAENCSYPQFIKLLSEALSFANHINLQCNELSSKFAMTLLHDLAKNLHLASKKFYLSLANNQLGNSAAFFIGQLISTHPTLQHVDVSSNQIGKRGLIMLLSQAITGPHQTLKIKLEYNPTAPLSILFFSRLLDTRNNIYVSENEINISEILSICYQYKKNNIYKAVSLTSEFFNIIELINELQFESTLDYQTMLRYCILTYAITAEKDDCLGNILRKLL